MRIRRIFAATITVVSVVVLAGCTSASIDTTDTTPVVPQSYSLRAVDNGDMNVIRSCNREPGSGVLLSFDDYGTPEQVISILDALREHNAQAAFFPTGEWALENLDLINRMKTEGHIVGNHTQTHARIGELAEKDPDRFYSETFPLEGVANTDPMWLRPPYEEGVFSENMRWRLAEKNVQMCTWTADTYDWNGDTVEQMIHRLAVGDQASPVPLAADGVVLMHMNADHAAEMVGAIVAHLESKNLKVAPPAS